jgi:hypothetical protein
MQLYRIALSALVIACAAATRARADEDPVEAQRSAARELGTQGMEAYFDQDYARAAEQLERAYKLFPTPTLGLWSGRALIQTGHWVAAAERLREAELASAAVGDNAAQQKAQSDAAAERTQLLARTPSLRVQVEGALPDEVSLSIDGVAVARERVGSAQPIDPGKHKLSAVFHAQRVVLDVAVLPNEQQTAHVVFQSEPLVVPPPPSPPSSPPPPLMAAATAVPAADSGPTWLRPAAYVSFGLGAAGAATSLVATLLASNKLDACAQRGGEYYCQDREADAYEDLRGLATLSFYAGAALAGGGLVLWLLAPSQDEPLRVAARPLGAEVSLTF